MNKSLQNFERLVLVCIDSYDSEKRRILQHDFFSGEEKRLHFFSPDRGDCRSRKMLQNASFLAIVAVDTDENEPSKARQLDS